MSVIAVGAYNAPLFQKALKICGVRNLIVPEWNIYAMGDAIDLTDPKKRVLRLAEAKVDRYAEEERPRNSIIFGFHSVAMFGEKELPSAKSREELVDIFDKICGRTFDYRAGIAVGKTGSGGLIWKMSSERVKLEPSIVKLSREQVADFVRRIPEDRISASGPDYRPFTNEYFAELVEEVDVESRIFTNLLVPTIQSALL